MKYYGLFRILPPVRNAISDIVSPATGLTAGVTVDVVEEAQQSQQGGGGIGALLLLVVSRVSQISDDIGLISFIITFPPPESLFRFEVMKPLVRSMTEMTKLNVERELLLSSGSPDRIRSTMWKNRQIILKTILHSVGLSRVTSRERIKRNWPSWPGARQTDFRKTDLICRLWPPDYPMINDPFNSKIFRNQSGEIFPVIFY